MVTANAPITIDALARQMANRVNRMEHMMEDMQVQPAPAAIASAPAYKDALQSFVVGSQILNFMEGVSTEYRETINDCVAFANIYTNNMIGKVGELTGNMLRDWYTLYFSTLVDLGWTPQVQEFKTYEANSQEADVSKALLEIATSFLGNVPGAVEIIKGVLDALTQQENQNSPWITLFNTQTPMQHGSRFQMGLVRPDPDANKGFLVSNMAFYVDAKEDITQVLFFKWTEEKATLWTSEGDLTINQTAIDAVKDDVKKKIKNRAANFIKNIEI